MYIYIYIYLYLFIYLFIYLYKYPSPDCLIIFRWQLKVGTTAEKSCPAGPHRLLLMIEILHYLKDPKLWESWYIPYYGYVVQDLYHQPYHMIDFDSREINCLWQSFAWPPRGLMGLGNQGYSKPQKTGNRIKDNWCLDSLYITLKD